MPDGERIGALLERRAKLHRISPSRPIGDVAAGVGFIDAAGVVYTSGKGSLPSLTQAIVGREIHGSWMADPEVHRIHDLLGEVFRGDVVEATLFGGKQCVMPARLAPVVARIAADPDRCEAAVDALSPDARTLYDLLTASGAVRMDELPIETKAGRKARKELQRQLLVWPHEIHTDRGYHTVILKAWDTGPFASHASDQCYDDAVDGLIRAAIAAAVLVPEREARRWLPFGQARLDALTRAGELVVLKDGRKSFVCESAG